VRFCAIGWHQVTEREFTLAESVVRTGARRRALQLWADGGVIHSTEGTDRAGTGVHRRFPESELRIAAVLGALADLGLPIGFLRSLANALRISVRISSLGNDERKAAFARACEGLGRNYMLIAKVGRNQIQVSFATDAQGPISIDPERDLPALRVGRRAVTVIIDLMRVLEPLAR
jgi:hypothetical protein